MALGITPKGALSGAASGAALGSAIPGIGTAVGAIGGGLLGLFSGSKDKSKETMEQQFQNEKEMMGLQHGYNEQMAQANQERAKDIWNYTNYENQVKHMKQAGLSVGLMYGNGGGMNASTSGGQGSGVTNAGTNAVAMGIQQRATDAQIKQLESQTRVNDALATKTMAEAKKTATVDTEKGWKEIDNLIEQTANEKEKKFLIRAQTRVETAQEDLIAITENYTKARENEVKMNLRYMEKSIEQMVEQTKGQKIGNELQSRIIEELIEQAALTTAQMAKNLTKTDFEMQDLAMRIKDTLNQMVNRTKGTEISWRQLELMAESIMKDFEARMSGVEVQEKGLILDAIKSVIAGFAKTK
jgi:hypothetical protein